MTRRSSSNGIASSREPTPGRMTDDDEGASSVKELVAARAPEPEPEPEPQPALDANGDDDDEVPDEWDS